MKILLKKESSTMYSSIKLLKWINEDFFLFTYRYSDCCLLAVSKTSFSMQVSVLNVCQHSHGNLFSLTAELN